tara:strand:+ start:2007 stop:2708 length:702 start_codon:yes stop_codon:yes gene_type:complete
VYKYNICHQIQRIAKSLTSLTGLTTPTTTAGCWKAPITCWLLEGTNNMLKFNRFEKNNLNVNFIYKFLQSISAEVKYMVHGGKAAIYYINQMNQSNVNKSNLLLSQATNDYDIWVAKEDFDKFQALLGVYVSKHARHPLNTRVGELAGHNFIMYGVKQQGKNLDNILDVSIVPSSKFPRRNFDQASGLWYAPKQYVVNNLVKTIRNYSNVNTPLKVSKRSARLRVLQSSNKSK